MKSTITIDGKEITFKASTKTPLLYRQLIGSDLFTDMNRVQEDQYNALEEDLLYIFNPLEYRDGTNGLLCGISSTDLVPCAFKCIVSPTPLRHSEALRERLKFSKKEISQMKKMNMLTITNEF